GQAGGAGQGPRDRGRGRPAAAAGQGRRQEAAAAGEVERFTLGSTTPRSGSRQTSVATPGTEVWRLPLPGAIRLGTALVGVRCGEWKQENPIRAGARMGFVLLASRRTARRRTVSL